MIGLAWTARGKVRQAWNGRCVQSSPCGFRLVLAWQARNDLVRRVPSQIGKRRHRRHGVAGPVGVGHCGLRSAMAWQVWLVTEWIAEARQAWRDLKWISGPRLSTFVVRQARIAGARAG